MSHGRSETATGPHCCEQVDPPATGGRARDESGRVLLADGGTADADDAGTKETGDGTPGEAESPDGSEPPVDGGAAPDGDASAADGAADPAALSCPDCGESIAAADNFCRFCGAEVAHVGPGGELAACPDCEADVDAEDSFCRDCGADLDAYRGGEDGTSSDADGTAPDADESAADDAVAGGDDSDDGPPVRLVVRNREIQVSDGETLGREIRSVVMDTGGDEDDAVRIHREHVRFEREGGQYYLVDLGRNPTVVDGEPLERGDRVPVSPGDRIELSNVAKMRVEDA